MPPTTSEPATPAAMFGIISTVVFHMVTFTSAPTSIPCAISQKIVAPSKTSIPQLLFVLKIDDLENNFFYVILEHNLKKSFEPLAR
jgi:hypothetical protein